MTGPRSKPLPFFVYGTLKRGGANHHLLAGERLVEPTRTVPGFCLYELDGYPGMVADASEPYGVEGELWEVDRSQVPLLDAFEGVWEGLYRRELIGLAHGSRLPHAFAYIYAGSVDGRRRAGVRWP